MKLKDQSMTFKILHEKNIQKPEETHVAQYQIFMVNHENQVSIRFSLQKKKQDGRGIAIAWLKTPTLLRSLKSQSVIQWKSELLKEMERQGEQM